MAQTKMEQLQQMRYRYFHIYFIASMDHWTAILDATKDVVI